MGNSTLELLEIGIICLKFHSRSNGFHNTPAAEVWYVKSLLEFYCLVALRIILCVEQMATHFLLCTLALERTNLDILNSYFLFYFIVCFHDNISNR
jgi:hypothetical protein